MCLKNEQPAVSDLTGTIGIDSREQLTQDLVRIEGERNRLLMTQDAPFLPDARNCSARSVSWMFSNFRNMAHWISSWLT
jgi:hypothetical protein